MPLRIRALLVAALAIAAAFFAMPGFSGATYTTTTNNTGTVTAASDWTPPTVAVTAPAGGATVSGSATVTAAASDASGIASVQLQYALSGSSTWTNLCAARTTAPYTCSWATTTFTDGGYQLRAIALDNAGYSATSAVVAVTVLNTATVTMADPGDNLRGNATVTATVAGYGNQTLTSFRIEYSVADANSWTTICSTTTASSLSCTWNTSALSNTYDVRGYAVVSGKVYTDIVPVVTVDNTAPTGSITSPGTGNTLSGTVSLVTNAADAHSGVATIALQYAPAGTTTWTAACSVGTSPWTCRWDTTTVADRSYDLRALITDAAGNSRTSATVSGVLVSNVLPTVSIESPLAGAYVGGNVSVATNASSSVSITKVSIQARTGTGAFTEVCAATATPYTCTWNTGTLTGSYDVRAVLTDSLLRTATSATLTVNVDNSVLKAHDVQTINSGTAGKVNTGDQLVLTYSSQVAPASILTGWNGASTSVTAQVVDGATLGKTATDDTFSVNGPNLGTVNLRGNFVKANKSLVMAGSTMVASTTTVNGQTATVVTITIGAITGSPTTSTSLAHMIWSPSASAKTPGGAVCSTSPATESGALDKDF